MNELDNELAAVTDALLDGREIGVVSAENRELVEVVRGLRETISPQDAPSELFQRRLTTMLNTEWERDHRATLRLLDRPLMRVAGLAAAVVLVLGALLVLAIPEETLPLQGAAVGLSDAAALVVLLGVVGLALVYWRSRH